MKQLIVFLFIICLSTNAEINVIYGYPTKKKSLEQEKLEYYRNMNKRFKEEEKARKLEAKQAEANIKAQQVQNEINRQAQEEANKRAEIDRLFKANPIGTSKYFVREGKAYKIYEYPSGRYLYTSSKQPKK